MITTTGNTTAEPQHQSITQQQRQQLQQFNMQQVSSQQSLSDMSDPNCSLSHHQYHYIQYPAYYQLMQDRLTTSTTTCRCPCSCNPNRAQPQQDHKASSSIPLESSSPARHKHQHSDDSQMAVAVIVHRQAGSGGGSGNGDGPNSNQQQVAKAKSEQSLMGHSYQALENYSPEEKQLNVDIIGAHSSCGCELECTCEITSLPPTKSKHCAKVGLSEIMLGADEITVSESDNNSIIVKRKGRESEKERDAKKSNTWCAHKPNNTSSGVRERLQKSTDANYNSSQIDVYSDEEDDGINSCLKMQNSGILEDDRRPPLPPRPPPRPRNVVVNMNAHRNGTGIKKYVVWCLICGGFSCLLGILFLGVYFLLHSYTITVGNFETVPTFVPATLLILTGLCIMSLARRRNRYSYLIKLSGACGLISALTCALVTVTTTVLHMSRLQALRECEYAQKTRTCTCYSDMIESQVERVDKEGVRLVFDSLSDCGVVHGSLYSCLRAIFGLSVAGVLIAVFSCMLVYQLLSHERKKMYWEQLELRCRSLYTSQQGPPPPNMAAMAAVGRANVCRCCEQCHAHRQLTLPQAVSPAAYPWDDGADGPRFWTGQPPGNFYSPNPGGDDLHNSAVANSGTCRGHNLSHTRSRGSGWSWPRMPWQRSSPVTSNRFRQTPSSPDSQYGFSNTTAVVPPINEVTLSNGAGDEVTMLSQQPTNHGQTFNVMTTGNLPYGVWGPPPPYSDPNSPARRGYYQFMHHAPNPVCLNATSDRQSTTSGVEQPHATMECHSHHHRSAYIDGNQTVTDGTAYCAQSSSMRSLSGKRQAANGGFKSKGGGDYENTFSDSDGTRDNFSNTLPTRKAKKRVEAGVKSIGPNSQSTQRVNVQNVFMNNVNVVDNNMSMSNNEHGYQELLETTDNTNIMSGQNSMNVVNMTRGGQSTQRHKIAGVENSAFQNSAECTPTVHTDNQDSCDPTESEVYFADVSSCCNISVKNDNYYDEANQQNNKQLCRNHHHSTSAHSPVNNNSDEDYLAQRFGKRENSIRSRLPFPQVACTDDYDKASNNNTMQKEISRQSMCSVESEAKTEFTDLSPSTPCGNKFPPSQFATSQCENSINDESTTVAPPPPKFVASFPPYLSESQSLEAHRRSTRNVNDILHASTEAQYEVINDQVVQPPSLLSTPCKPVNFPISPKGKRSLKCKNTAGLKAQNVKKSNVKEKRFEKSTPPYQSDLEWSDSSNCTNDRQRL